MSKWTKVDKCSDWTPHFIDLQNDLCYFARRYHSQGGWQMNQEIANLKKKPSSSSQELYYKDKAIKQCAKEIETLINGRAVTVAAIPSSKLPGHPEYDDRMEKVLSELKNLNSNIIIETPISIVASIQSSSSGGPSSPSAIMANYQWNGFQGPTPNLLVLIDDVLTRGSHFKAYKDTVHMHHPEIRVSGIFWAMTKH